MKTIYILMVTVLLNACNTTKTAAKVTVLDNKEHNTSKTAIQNMNYNIEYTEMSRGIYRLIRIENSEITTQKDRTSKPIIKTLTKKELNALSNTLNILSLKDLAKLEAPSKAHQYDGAAIATLKVYNETETFQTVSFDAGNPHQDIAPLIEKILLLSKKI